MKNKIYYCFSIVLIFCSVGTCIAQTRKSKTATLDRPKLVVGIVVDQMRWDYLYRYDDRYRNNGFKRLLNEGFSCENTNLDYIPTVTAAGHTCIYTGSVPSIHGIAGNDFIMQATGKSVYCTGDTTVQTVGSISKAGEMSPQNLLVSTLTDELRLATHFRSKVIGIALKDRGGILPAGHTANAAYWFDDMTGNWITSTYYMSDLPVWLKNFNALKLAEKYLKQDWPTLYPINSYLQSTEDNNGYEGKFKGVDAPIMPVKTSQLMGTDFSLIRNTPYGNSITLDMARETIKQENLGKSESTDFLAVSLSSTDYIGHQFGVNAIETEDTYLRLDQDIANFLNYLDTTIGKGKYTVFLTADHGAAHNVNFLIDHHIPAGLWESQAILKNLNDFLSEKYKYGQIALNFNNYQINLNNKLIENNKLDIAVIKRECIEFLQKQKGVAYIIDMEHVTSANIPEILRTRIINGYNSERSGCIQIILKPGWYDGHGPTGTTHGTWNPYDTHIPFLLMGWGIKKGHTNRATNMTDITPTIAALLHIQVPNGCIGHPITEVFKN